MGASVTKVGMRWRITYDFGSNPEFGIRAIIPLFWLSRRVALIAGSAPKRHRNFGITRWSRQPAEFKNQRFIAVPHRLFPSSRWTVLDNLL